jgi:hypothetical protein
MCLVIPEDKIKEPHGGSLILGAYRQKDADMEFWCGVPLLTALELRINAKPGIERESRRWLVTTNSQQSYIEEVAGRVRG